MTTALGTYFRNIIFNWLKGTAAPLTPDLYAALYSVAPTRAGTGGTDITNVVSTGRILIPKTDWSAITTTSTYLEIQTNSDRSFGNALSTGTTNYIALFDAATSGNMWALQPVTGFAAIVGIPLVIKAGTLKIRIGTSVWSNYFVTKWLNYLKNTSAGTPPANTYVGLWNGDPLATGLGTAEVTTNIWSARQAIASGNWSSILSSGDTLYIQNASPITTGVGASSTQSVTHTVLLDAATSGNHLLRIPSTPTYISTAGSPTSIVTGALNLLLP